MRFSQFLDNYGGMGREIQFFQKVEIQMTQNLTNI